MTVDIEVLGEVFAILKQYIPSKDRQEAADNLMSSMVDILGDHELSEFAASDTTLLRAFKEYANDDDASDLDPSEADDYED